MRLPLPALAWALAAVLPASEACTTADQARLVAEMKTRGQAVKVHRVLQADGTPGWVVLVRQPAKPGKGGRLVPARHGWKLSIDRDLGKVRQKVKIPNPPAPPE